MENIEKFLLVFIIQVSALIFWWYMGKKAGYKERESILQSNTLICKIGRETALEIRTIKDEYFEVRVFDKKLVRIID